MDLRMPDMSGLEAILAIRKEFPQARIIVLTTYAGASGYLLKNLVRKELIDTIRIVHGGKRRIPPEIATEIAEHVADDALSALDASDRTHAVMIALKREILDL
jgi:DNA-binding NarL/FixJ family response regulator